ncbi:hypothetical protein ACIQRS_03160 [Streptomyces termitum]|uniref:Uncharacterized protein n=1 Tax=Streptomyces termitum TaxID=67368 RepID=A0A918SV43_9ACTN|nr:hypothetical protein [Streptomyces termitum]GHA71919.1 hypothetical protein GCM10010305_12660 [Streptomyces termitum]
MEQSTGPSIQPLHGASADPGFIPGITASPVPEGVTEHPDDAGGETAGAPADERADAAGDASGAEDAADGDGPVFEAADRRGRITADAEGVRLRYDEEECEFRWDEIGAVESAAKRFGKRLSVIVHTPDRRWYPIELDAPDRAGLAAWEAELDAVLDAYFDETAEA